MVTAASAKKENVLTFAAIDAEGRRRSLIWRFYVRGSDIFFGPSLHFGAPRPSNFHASLHRDGRCHRTFDGQFFDEVGRMRTGLTDAKTRRWQRPKTPPMLSAPAGVTVYSIAVLPDDPTAEPPNRVGETYDMVLPAPGPGYAAELVIVYSNRKPEDFKAGGVTILRHQALTNGETVYFLGHVTAYDPSGLQRKYPQSKHNAVWLGPPGAPVQLPPDFRGVLFLDPDGPVSGVNAPGAMDVSVRVNPDDPQHLEYVLVQPQHDQTRVRWKLRDFMRRFWPLLALSAAVVALVSYLISR